MLRPSTCPSAARASRNDVAIGSTVAAVLTRSMVTSGNVALSCARAGIAALSHSTNKLRGGSLDDLVGTGEHGLRHGEPQGLRGLEIDDQLELGRLLHR